MPRQTEPSINNALGNILQGMMRTCAVRSEISGAFQGYSGRQPDILITAPYRSPVVIEAEVRPSGNAENEAVSRLGLELAGGTGNVEAAIALYYPENMRGYDDLHAALRDATLEYCVFTKEETEITRFPKSGWLNGGVSDLAELARLVSVPQSLVDDAANRLQYGIDRANAVLDEAAELGTANTEDIANLLGMTDVSQTRRMACAVIANAMVFHHHIARQHTEIRALNRLWRSAVDNPQARVADAWDEILKINYWPIFAVARDIVNLLPLHAAARILDELRETAQGINSTGAAFAHDLTGRVFQRLIADRKYLATFYTLPASASLLARIAVAKLDGIDWSDPDAIAQLRVGDFACGTGALLSAVYEQIALRHEKAGGDPADLHKAMMEEVLYGCDVMPSAIHITSSTLSGMQPTIGYGQSRLYNMPYGRQSDGTVAIGSLELLQSSSVMTLFNTSDPALRTGSAGEETAANIIVDIPDESFDIVIMNPPFTRNTGQEGKHIGVANRAFAAFDADDKEQRDMGKRLTSLSKGTAYHGNAGIASAFAALGHRKLKQGGVLALVLPLTSAVGLSWYKFRQMFAEHYADLSVFSIASTKKDVSFSSDTAIAECLIVARKLHTNEASSATVDFTSLVRRPTGFVYSAALTSAYTSTDNVRRIEDGPYGGTSLTVGDERVGEMLTAPYDRDGGAWSAVRLLDSSVAQTTYALGNSRLWLPGNLTSKELQCVPLSIVGQMGLYHIDINGPAPRGPFDKDVASPTATYPALWNHNAKNEKNIICESDSQLLVRQGFEKKAYEQWKTASRCHLNRDFTLGSQPLAVAFTERATIGGRAWPNVIFSDERYDYAFAVWGNCTLGLLSYWWHSSIQQPGRGIISIRAAETLPILDLRALTDAQLATAHDIFDDFRERDLLPAYLADADANRALLDRRVLRDMLGFGEDVYQGVRLLAAKWCAEPSVHGGKGRPGGAAFVA